MEAALLHFILDITTLLGPDVAQHLRKDELEGVVADGSALRPVGRRYRVEAVIGYVEGCAEAVTALFGGVSVDAAQLCHILLSAKDAGYDNCVKRNALDGQRVEETAPDIV